MITSEVHYPFCEETWYTHSQKMALLSNTVNKAHYMIDREETRNFNKTAWNYDLTISDYATCKEN